jgi:GTP-binding protein
MEDFTPDQIEAARKIFSGECDFILGVNNLTQLPDADMPEVAFAGRSNVGKSSLLNALTNRKDLARTSNTPGRTQQLNFFNLANAIYLVDMPGYGYAKVSKTQRSEWDSLIFDYLRGRPNLRCVFVLVDSRHGLKDSDEDLMKMLDTAAVPYRIVLTKADKGKQLDAMKEEIAGVLKKHPAAWPSVMATSSWKNEGLAELRACVLSFA